MVLVVSRTRSRARSIKTTTRVDPRQWQVITNRKPVDNSGSSVTTPYPLPVLVASYLIVHLPPSLLPTIEEERSSHDYNFDSRLMWS